MKNVIKWCPEFAYYLGYLWADGHICRVSISLEINSNDANAILPHLSKIDFLKLNLYNRHREGCKPCTRINFTSAKLYDSFFSIYFNEKSLSSPDKLLEIIPDKLKRYFFLGLIDGDGCFYVSKNGKTKQFEISSSYDQDWEYIINLFETINIKKFTIQKSETKNGNSSKIRVVNYNDIEKIYNYLYPSGYEIGLKRKYDKCKLIIDNKPRYTCNNEFLEKEILIEKIDELNDINLVSKYFNCSTKKIYNHCLKYNITTNGFVRSIRLRNDEYMNIVESKKYIQSFKLKSKNEWVIFCKNGNRPKNIPSNPYEFYKDNGWVSYGDWLGF